jgi:hypothetical protein
VKAHETFTVDGSTVTVLVSTELLERLGEWSEPLQVMIRETPGVGTGWELIFRTVEANR